MLEIIYGHKIEENFLSQKKISIGHGLPRHGQTDFITLIEEEVDMRNGIVCWATMKWHFWRRKSIN